MGRRIRGEGRVCTVGAKFAILSKPGLDGTIFVQPSSLHGITCKPGEQLPSLLDTLHHNDMCSFEADSQEERNGSKWRAVDGTVKVIRQAQAYQGEGVITKLDESNGQFGFIRSSLGDVFFNASSVRPATKDITKVLKVNQIVRFTAIKGTKSPTVQLRATLVCPRSHKLVDTLIPASTLTSTTQTSSTTSVTTSTSVTSATATESAPTNKAALKENNTKQNNETSIKRPDTVTITTTTVQNGGAVPSPARPVTHNAWSNRLHITTSNGSSNGVNEASSDNSYNVWTTRPIVPTSPLATTNFLYDKQIANSGDHANSFDGDSNSAPSSLAGGSVHSGGNPARETPDNMPVNIGQSPLNSPLTSLDQSLNGINTNVLSTSDTYRQTVPLLTSNNSQINNTAPLLSNTTHQATTPLLTQNLFGSTLNNSCAAARPLDALISGNNSITQDTHYTPWTGFGFSSQSSTQQKQQQFLRSNEYNNDDVFLLNNREQLPSFQRSQSPLLRHGHTQSLTTDSMSTNIEHNKFAQAAINNNRRVWSTDQPTNIPYYGDSLPTLQPLSDYERMRFRNNQNSDEQMKQKQQQQHNFQCNTDTWNTLINNPASGGGGGSMAGYWGADSMNKLLQQQQQQMTPIEQRNAFPDAVQQLWPQTANTGQLSSQYPQMNEKIWCTTTYDSQRPTAAMMGTAAALNNQQQNYLSLMRQNNNNNTMNTNTREPSVVDASTTSGLSSTANVGSA